MATCWISRSQSRRNKHAAKKFFCQASSIASTRDYRARMQDRFLVWSEVTRGETAASQRTIFSNPPLLSALPLLLPKALLLSQQVDNALPATPIFSALLKLLRASGSS
jgi:hypothetical protein